MTRSSSRAAVLVDTDVFSILYIDPVKAANRGLPVEQLRAQPAGLQVVIAFQARAEVLAGAMVGSWGERKLADTRAKLDSAPTISIDSGVVDAYASLTAACRRVGQALHDKIHTGDRWIAACAISKEVPLLSLDGMYAGAPDLALLGG